MGKGEETNKAVYKTFIDIFRSEGKIVLPNDPYIEQFIVATALKTFRFPFAIERERSGGTSIEITLPADVYGKVDDLVFHFNQLREFEALIAAISHADPVCLSYPAQSERVPSPWDMIYPVDKLPLVVAQRGFITAFERWKSSKEEDQNITLKLYRVHGRSPEKDEQAYRSLLGQDLRPFTPGELGMMTIQVFRRILNDHPELRYKA